MKHTRTSRPESPMRDIRDRIIAHGTEPFPCTICHGIKNYNRALCELVTRGELKHAGFIKKTLTHEVKAYQQTEGFGVYKHPIRGRVVDLLIQNLPAGSVTIHRIQ